MYNHQIKTIPITIAQYKAYKIPKLKDKNDNSYSLPEYFD